MSKIFRKINYQQKIVISILIPIFCFIIFIPVFDYFDGHNGKWELNSDGSKILRPDAFEPFFLKKTWFIWLLFISLLSILEFKLFDKK